MDQVTKAAEKVEAATEVEAERTPQVEVKGPSLSTQLFGGTAAFLGTVTIVIFLTYFLLAVGDLFLQKLVTVLPQFNDKKKAVAIARETEAQISAYLLTSTFVNIGVGVVTALVLWLLDMPNAVLWGVVAALLNFVPYIGAVVNMVILGLAALLAFESTTDALMVPAAFFAINIIEGNLVTPAHPGPPDAAQYGGPLHRPRLLVVPVGYPGGHPRGTDHGGAQDHVRPHRVAGADRGVSGEVTLKCHGTAASRSAASSFGSAAGCGSTASAARGGGSFCATWCCG